MNYFAHLTLAQPTAASKVGNLMGDFMRGVREQDLPPAVRDGLHNHRLVDRFTDTYPLVVDSRRLFSPARRRFAGVAMDVLFDHFLIRHWERFYEQPVPQAIRDEYDWLRTGQPLMPARMQVVTGRMVDYDWFSHYADLKNVGEALDRIAGRVRFANQFRGMIEEIDHHYAELEAVFLTLYPALRAEVEKQGVEWVR